MSESNHEAEAFSLDEWFEQHLDLLNGLDHFPAGEPGVFLSRRQAWRACKWWEDSYFEAMAFIKSLRDMASSPHVGDGWSEAEFAIVEFALRMYDKGFTLGAGGEEIDKAKGRKKGAATNRQAAEERHRRIREVYLNCPQSMSDAERYARIKQVTGIKSDQTIRTALRVL